MACRDEELADIVDAAGLYAASEHGGWVLGRTRNDRIRTSIWGRSFVALVAAFALMGVACGDDDSSSDGDAVEVGPGAEVSTPAEEDASEEPAWADRVPGAAEPQASLESRVAALALTGRPQLPSAAPNPKASPITGDYSGTIELELAYYDLCQGGGTPEFARSATYELTGDVYLNPPAEEDGVQERSPFNLMFGSETGVEGEFLIWSGQVAIDQRDGERVLIDYWDIEQDGAEISGVLTDRWPGLIFNYIRTAEPLVICQPQHGIAIALPDPIAEGAELQGTVTENRVELELLGQSLDGLVRFRAVIDAERDD